MGLPAKLGIGSFAMVAVLAAAAPAVSACIYIGTWLPVVGPVGVCI